jgi:putative ABC transport system permease protein
LAATGSQPAGTPISSASIAFWRRNLTHRKLRSALAVSGVGFAVLFMFIQLGFLATVESTARALTSRLSGELILISPRFMNLRLTHDIPRSRLFQAQAVPGVRDVVPLYVRYTRWRSAAGDGSCEMLALGVSLEGPSALTVVDPVRDEAVLRRPDAVLMDSLAQGKCGPTGEGALGDVNDRRRMSVGGHYTLGVGLQSDGSFVVGDGAFYELFGGHRLERPQMGIVFVAPESDPREVARGLRARLPPDTRVVTRDQLESEQVRFWVDETAVGNMFRLGTLVGFVVGIVILYQVLSTDIRNQQQQFATLKAMGYSDRQLYGLVLRQGWAYALLGYVPGAVCALAVYGIAHHTTLLPIFMTASRAAFVLLLTVVMCTAAAVLSLRRIADADPAELF